MELLEPLGVAHVGLLAGHAFDMAGIDQTHLDAGLFEQVIAVDPVVAGTLHGHGRHTAGQQPVAQFDQATGEACEGAHMLRASVGWDCHDDLRRSNVYAARVGIGFCVDLVLGLAGAVAIVPVAARFGCLGAIDGHCLFGVAWFGARAVGVKKF